MQCWKTARFKYSKLFRLRGEGPLWASFFYKHNCNNFKVRPMFFKASTQKVQKFCQICSVTGCTWKSLRAEFGRLIEKRNCCSPLNIDTLLLLGQPWAKCVQNEECRANKHSADALYYCPRQRCHFEMVNTSVRSLGV